MPLRNDGNEQDLRVRPELNAPSLASDNPFTGEGREQPDFCEDGHGSQVDAPPIITTPDGQFTYNWLSTAEICPSGFSPKTTSLLFMRLLKNHFSNPDNIMDPLLKSYVYSEDPTLSKIRIVLNTNYSSNVGQVPALVVKRLEQKMTRVVLDDFGDGGDPLMGLPHFVRFVNGGHRVICTGQADGFMEALAFEVFSLLNCVSPVIRRALPMHDFQVLGMSEVGILEDLGQTFGITIDSTYIYEYGWLIENIAPVVHGARTDVTAQISTPE